MGKRSNFKRRPQDAYDTPAEAVAPLIPHLGLERKCVTTFWEPCAGAYDLARALEAHGGLQSTRASDIEPRSPFVDRADAMEIAPPLVDIIITNPPWTRSILHPMIEHFSDICPTWLLFDADWMHTKQAAPYLPRLRKIVSVGRVKWIPDSPHTGKDNVCWYLFENPVHARLGPDTEFVGRAA